MKPPFTYFGGKTAIADQIVALFPTHEHYVEPFAGSLAVLLAKPQSKMETVSDLDGELMNFWRVLRDRPEDLARACALTPHSRAEYLTCYEPATDDLERARRVWVNLTQGRGGQMRRTGWRYYADPSGGASMPGYLGAYTARLMPAAERLMSVSLECLDALDIIRRYGSHPGTLIYADPPYLESVRAKHIRGSVRGPQYRHELRADEDHRELAEALSACAAAVVLSGYDAPLYAELYEGWHRTHIGAVAGNGVVAARARTEVLWSNRPFPQATLFDAEGCIVIPARFEFTRIPGLTVRSVIWSVSTVALVAVYVLLDHRKPAPVPGRPVDGEPLSEAERAVWEAIEDAAMDEAMLDAGLGILRPEEGPC